MHLRDSQANKGTFVVHWPLIITLERKQRKPRKAMCVPNVRASEKLSIQDKASSISSLL